MIFGRRKKQQLIEEAVDVASDMVKKKAEIAVARSTNKVYDSIPAVIGVLSLIFMVPGSAEIVQTATNLASSTDKATIIIETLNIYNK